MMMKSIEEQRFERKRKMTKDVSKKNDKKDATQKIEGIICRLKSKRLQMPDVPEEFRMHPDILRAERKLEIRKSAYVRVVQLSLFACRGSDRSGHFRCFSDLKQQISRV